MGCMGAHARHIENKYMQSTRCGTVPNAKNRRLRLVFSSRSLAKWLHISIKNEVIHIAGNVVKKSAVFRVTVRAVSLSKDASPVNP